MKVAGMECIKSHKNIRWPLLYTAVNKGLIAFVDYAFTEMLLRNHQQANEKVAAFLCHLSFSARLGHLCLKMEQGTISPSPEELWFSNSQEVPSNELKRLLQGIDEGMKALPDTILSQVTDESIPKTPICYFEKFIYLQKNWVYESYFLKNLQRLLSTNPSIMPNLNSLGELTERMRRMGEITDQQSQAIVRSVENSLTLICGGPGSGKTYTAAQFIKVFWHSLSPQQKETYEIAVAAPTGKAASNLYNSLQKTLHGMPLLESIQPKTLHSLLGIKKKVSQKVLSADLILVDEASMIDAKLMSQLISSVKVGARLVFLGDQHQLPAVEAGALFADMIFLFCNEKNLAKHWIELTTCHRTEIKDLVTFARIVNEGKAHEAASFFENKSVQQNVKCHFFEKGCLNKLKEHLINYVWPLFPKSSFCSEDPHDILEQFNHFRILNPLRKGFLGAEEINRLLFQQACSSAQTEWIAVPIVISANDYQMNLFNGEGGLLIHRKDSWKQEYLHEGNYALFPEVSKSFRKIPAILLPKFEYAYCLSVHKSQGSEFEKVLLLLPERTEIFGREMLYTAITRAKKMIEIWTTNDTLVETIQRRTERHSGLCYRMEKNLPC